MSRKLLRLMTAAMKKATMTTKPAKMPGSALPSDSMSQVRIRLA
jgi:hypothetical protein